MTTYTYPNNDAMLNRAKKVLPNGIYGHLGTTHRNPLDHYPIFSEKAEGAYFWDINGNKFLDFMCAFGPNMLGYNDTDVDAAAI